MAVFSCFFMWVALNSLLIVQTKIVYNLFTPESRPMALGLNITGLRLGGCAGYFFSGPMLAKYGSLPVLWSVGSLCAVTAFAAVAFCLLYRGTYIAQAVRQCYMRQPAVKMSCAQIT